MPVRAAILFVLVAGTACSRSEGGARENSVRQITLDPVATLTIPDAAPDGSWALNGWESVQLLPGGGYAVATSTAIHEFSAAGRHVATLGRQGDGPGEFQLIDGFAACPNGSVVVTDFIARRLTLLRPARSTASVVAYRGNRVSNGIVPIACHGSNLVLEDEAGNLGGPPPHDELHRSATLVLRGDSTLTAFDTIAAVPSVNIYDGLQQPFGPGSAVAVIGTTLAYGSTDDSVVYLATPFDPTASVDTVMLRGLPVAPVTADMQRDRVAQSAKSTPPSIWEGELKAIYDRVPWPKTLPLWDKLVVDDSDRVWVREYRSSLIADSVPNRWHVVTRSGEWVATLTLPDREHLVVVRGGDAVVIERAEDGTEALEVRKIHGR
jgi:hypothetical protein